MASSVTIRQPPDELASVLPRCHRPRRRGTDTQTQAGHQKASFLHALLG